jgi:hypothetical protein
MKKILAAVIFVSCFFGCGRASSETIYKREGTGTPVPENTSKQESKEPEVKEEEVVKEDFEIKEYKYENPYATMYYMVVTSHAGIPVQLYVNATAYDAGNTMISAANSTLEIIGPEEQSIMSLYFENAKNVDHIDYSLQINKDVYYEPVLRNLSVESNLNGQNLILSIKNNGEKPAEFVQGTALFFDANDQIVSTDFTYFTDNDSEIKPGESISGQLSSYEAFDHVEYYLDGRASKWKN